MYLTTMCNYVYSETSILWIPLGPPILHVSMIHPSGVYACPFQRSLYMLKCLHSRGV